MACTSDVKYHYIHGLEYHLKKIEFLGNKIFEGLFVLGAFIFFGLIAHALLT